MVFIPSTTTIMVMMMMLLMRPVIRMRMAGGLVVYHSRNNKCMYENALITKYKSNKCIHNNFCSLSFPTFVLGTNTHTHRGRKTAGIYTFQHIRGLAEGNTKKKVQNK